jgi:hypothetical protein
MLPRACQYCKQAVLTVAMAWQSAKFNLDNLDHLCASPGTGPIRRQRWCAPCLLSKPTTSVAVLGHRNGTDAPIDDSFRRAELMRRCHRRVPPPRSGFAGFRFPREIIVLAVRWYLRYGLSYRDVEELLAERGIEVDPSRSSGGCSASHRC